MFPEKITCVAQDAENSKWYNINYEQKGMKEMSIKEQSNKREIEKQLQNLIGSNYQLFKKEFSLKKQLKETKEELDMTREGIRNLLSKIQTKKKSEDFHIRDLIITFTEVKPTYKFKVEPTDVLISHPQLTKIQTVWKVSAAKIKDIHPELVETKPSTPRLKIEDTNLEAKVASSLEVSKDDREISLL